MATTAQLELFKALKTHMRELEIERDAASGADRVSLSHRLEAAKLVFKWLSKAVE
jgi:hypothetical protein